MRKIFSLALFLALAAPHTRAGLLAQWPLNEGTGTLTADATGNGHNGVLVNGPAWVTGMSSNALSFTGDKRVDITSVAGLCPTNALTLSVWIKPTGPGYAAPSYSPFFAKGSPYYSGWGLYFTDTRKIIFQMTGQNGNSIGSAGTVPTNRWTLVVATFDGSHARLFLNGVLDRTTPWSGTRLTNSTAVTLGVLSGSSNELPGAIDDARIYDNALSETEIARLFLEQDRDRDGLIDANEVILGTNLDNPDSEGDGWRDGVEVAVGTDPRNGTGHPDLSTGLVGWWKLDEGTGTSTVDSGSGGNNGTLYNGSQWVSGVAGNALLFDGVNDYVACGATGSGSALAVTNLTMSYWLQTTNLEQWATMLERRVAETGYSVLWQQAYERVIPWLPGIPVVQIGFSDMNTNQWHLHTFTYDGHTLRSYLDSVERASASFTNALIDAQDRLYIGEGHGGKMDDVRVYNRALSAADVAALALMDSDGDGLPNALETRLGTNPNQADSDNDGMPDGWEIAHGFNPLNSVDGAADADGDGLSNAQEYALGTDPFVNGDADHDFWLDTAEVAAGTNPTDPSSHPEFTFSINNGADVVSSVQLQVNVATGIVAQTVIISEDIALSAAATNAFAQSFSYNLSSTNDGLRTVYLQLRSASGSNSAVFGRSVLLDTAGPSLTITAPTNGTVTAQRRLTIQGSASDANDAHAQSDPNKPLAVTVKDAFVNDRSTNGTWWSGPHDLAPGTNTFTVIAADRAGFSVTNSAWVIYNPTLATNVPVFSVDVTGTVVVGSNATAIAVAGGIDDENATVQIAVVDAVDDTVTNATVSAAVHGTNWWAELPVVAGSNIVVITAQNGGSAAATNCFNMVQNPDVFLEITSPAANTSVNATNVLVIGRASTNFNGSITINGTVALTSLGSGGIVFSNVVALGSVDANVLDVEAHGTDGRTAQFRQTVYGYEVLALHQEDAYPRNYGHVEDNCWFAHHYPDRHAYESSLIGNWDWVAPQGRYSGQLTDATHSYSGVFLSGGTSAFDYDFDPGSLIIDDSGWKHGDYSRDAKQIDGGGYLTELGYFWDCSGFYTNCVFASPPYGVGESANCCIDTREHMVEDISNRHTVTFIKHWPVDEEQTVILHFNGFYYSPGSDGFHPEQVTFWGQPGFLYSTNSPPESMIIGFLVKIRTNTRYTICDKDFTVPAFNYSGESCTPNAQSTFRWHETGQLLGYSSFGNVGVDLDIDGVDDKPNAEGKEDEEEIGKFMWWDANDANNNGTLDKDEEPSGGIANENALVKITLSLLTAEKVTTGKAQLQIAQGSDKIKIWREKTKKTKLIFGGSPPAVVWDLRTDTMPGILYIEGVAGSADVRDVVLKLIYESNKGEALQSDTVKLTIVPLFVIGSDQDLYGVCGHPSGNYALGVGANGRVVKYVYNELTTLNSGTTERLDGIGWKSDGSVAVIAGGPKSTGHVGVVLSYNGTSFTSLDAGSLPAGQTYIKFWDVAWQPSGNYCLLTAESPGAVYRCDGTTVTYLNGPPDSSDTTAVDWKPGGSGWILGDSGADWIWNETSSGFSRPTQRLPSTGLLELSWKPDGGELLVTGTSGRVWKYTESGGAQLLGTFGNDWVTGVAWQPDGQYAIVTGYNGLVLVYDTSKSKLYRVDCHTTTALEKAAWKPNDNYAIAVRHN